MSHSGKNNGGSVDELFIVRMVYLIITGRKLLIIMFRTVGRVSAGKF